MKISKAIITAAGQSQRRIPLQSLVDRDGTVKSVLRIIVEEALSAGVDEIAVVVCPGDEAAFAEGAGDLAGRLRFIKQSPPRGYGHALWCARKFAGRDAFLHFVSDHLHVSRAPKRCAQILAETAVQESCAVSAVQPTRESKLPYYGVVGGRHVPQRKNLYEIEAVREKPTPTEAERSLIVPGLRAGHYLCFFGIHILTPTVLDILDDSLSQLKAGETLQLSPALDALARKERYLALELPGQRYNVGVKYGLFMAQLALALEGRDRNEVLEQIVELLAQRERIEAPGE